MAKRFTRAEIRRIVGDNCTDEIENELVALHLGVVDPIKDDLDKYKAEADKVPEIQAELEKLKNGDDYKSKYESEHKAFEDYKKTIDTEKANIAKEKAVKAYFESKGIIGNNLDIAIRGAREEIGAIELDGEKIKDTKALDTLVDGTFKGLILTQTTQGARVASPITNTNATITTKADIYKKDANGHYIMTATERQNALMKLSEQQKGY